MYFPEKLNVQLWKERCTCLNILFPDWNSQKLVIPSWLAYILFRNLGAYCSNPKLVFGFKMDKTELWGGRSALYIVKLFKIREKYYLFLPLHEILCPEAGMWQWTLICLIPRWVSVIKPWKEKKYTYLKTCFLYFDYTTEIWVPDQGKPILESFGRRWE